MLMKEIPGALALLALVACADAREFYVSPHDRDQADGSIEQPYRSIPDAVVAVRVARKSGYTEPVTIVLREGRFQLNETLVLGMEDGTPAPSEAVTLPKYGAGTGNILRYNFVHDNLAHSLPAAIRCDDDQHETLIYGNVLYNNYGFSAGIASKGVNDIINNFIVAPVAPPRWGYVSFEWVPVTGSKVHRNIIISHPEGGTAYAERPKGRKRAGARNPQIVETDMDSNLYFHPTDPKWMDEHLRRMRAAGKEKASRFGDPLFKDPAGGDFSFGPGSPALALGIEPLGVSKMGRLDTPNSQQKSALLISDGTPFVPKDHFPKFSWEVTPQYFMFGDTQRVLKPEEVRSIAARTDFLCIEKSHGLRTLGAAELGAKHEAAAFKAIKPGIKVLFYFNSAYAYPFTSYSKGLTRDKIDRHPELKKFLLVDPKTGELAHRRNVFFFDVLNPELREWWASTVAKGVADSDCDGAFIDQMHGFAWLRPGKSGDVQKAMGEMMALLKKKMGPDKILLGNNANQGIARHVFPVIDANMFEHYGEDLLSKEKLLQDWADMLRIAKAGKMSIFRIGVEQDRTPVRNGDRPDGSRNRSSNMAALARERLDYYLACYLIGAQPYSYFQYGWGWTLSSGSLQDYPELHKPLGAPKGPYTRSSPKAWEFTREFEHASVWVDTEKGQGRITWQQQDE